MPSRTLMQPIQILLVEDNPGDIRLTQEAMAEAKMGNRLNVAKDGAEALDILRRIGAHANVPRPDLILLDLNLPKLDGREVLEAIKTDSKLKRIPVVVLTSSDAEEDILKSYDLYANCYITKPLDMTKFEAVVKSIEMFWFAIVKLPPKQTDVPDQ